MDDACAIEMKGGDLFHIAPARRPAASGRKRKHLRAPFF